MDRREFVTRGIGAVAVGAGVAGGFLACGGDGGLGPGNGNGDGDGDGTFDGTITLTSANTFDPAEVTIDVGDTVTWENGADRFHTITPGSGPNDDDPHDEWDRQTMEAADDTFEHTFNTAGTFEYFCEPHFDVGMRGTIIVE